MSDAPKRHDGKHAPSFGKLNRPKPRKPTLSTEPTPKHKRSAMVAIAALGTGALGLFAVASASRCQPNDPNQPTGQCRSSSWSGFMGSNHSSTAGTSNSTIQRGGFGRVGGMFSGHFGG